MKESRYVFSFSLKSPSTRTPSRFPKRAPMERAARLQGLLYISFKFLIKISLKRNFYLLSKVLGKERPSMFSQSAAAMEMTPISRALLSISFGVPGKGALLPGSPHTTPSERDAPFLEPSFHLSKSPVHEPPSRFPSHSSLGERRPIPRTLLHSSFKVPCTRAPFQVPFIQLPRRETPHS